MSNSYGQSYELFDVEITASPNESISLNSNYHDYNPFIVNNHIYFTSNREPDLLLEGENNWKNHHQTNIFTAKVKADRNNFGAVSLLSQHLGATINSGSIAFSVTGDSIIFAQETKSATGDEKIMQLYLSTLINNKWSRAEKLNIAFDSYSCGQPYYHSAKKTLYFVADTPEGMGGKDIYKTTLSGNIWSTPENLSAINTSADDMFPFLIDGILFFASDREGGKGGLDFYWKIDGQKKEVQNLSGINSEFDDFSLFIHDDLKRGYFSSNKSGSDDIYSFDLNREIIVNNEIAGNFSFMQIEGSASNIKVQVVNSDEFVLYETITDKDGNFLFQELDADGNYTLRALTEEELLMRLYNKEGDVAATFLSNEKKDFLFRQLGNENSGTMSLIPEDMIDLALNQGHLSAQLIYEDDPGRYPVNLKVELIDENDKMQFETLTDKQGNFDFKELSMSDNYLLKIAESDEDYLLLIYDLKGNVVAQLKKGEDGVFNYRKLNPANQNKLVLGPDDDLAFEYTSQTISGYFEYDNNKTLNREGLKVDVFNTSGELISAAPTNKEGQFRFRDLPLNSSLLFKLRDDGASFIMDDFTLYIFDRGGKKIAELKIGADGFFTFKPLGYETANNLSSVEEDNLQFILGDNTKKEIILVYFDSNKSEVKSDDMATINKLLKVLQSNERINVEISAYADAQANDEYNLALSSKRGHWIADYLIKKGIDKKRFAINAYGESKLVDEYNDALNRRAEIRLF